MKDQIAYLIDPHTFTISEIISEDGISWINKALECDCFTGAYSDDPNLPPLYVDDEGLYAENQAWFWYKGAHQPFTGKAIAMDVNSRGASVTPKMGIIEFASHVRWVMPMRTSSGVQWFKVPEPTRLKRLPARPVPAK